ncbi:MAG: hypothetical protein JRH20_15625 [Deltaproteobacteria bacterium]|nr:hypothetical protein [Deltaproteobacteria bacterium]
MLCACIVPPYAEPIEGENHAPVITVPVSWTRKTVNRSASQPFGKEEFNIEVRDQDLEQELSVRVFVNGDYDKVVTIDGGLIHAATNSDGTRLHRVIIAGLCDTVLDTLGTHLLELYVSDGDFAETTGPEVPPHALRAMVSWRIECEEPPPPPLGDGGL